jgi:ECF transporter S component (folate family)
MKDITVKKTVIMALFIALEIVLTRFVSIQTPIIRISFGFLPIAIVAMMFGPIYAGIGAAVGDIIGVALFPVGAYFPGFTLTAFLTGAVYGVFLYKRPKKTPSICIAAFIVTMILQLGLDTLWIRSLTGEAYLALLPARFIKSVIMTPVQIIFIRFAASEQFRIWQASGAKN